MASNPRCTAADPAFALAVGRSTAPDSRSGLPFASIIARLVDGWHRSQAMRVLGSLDDRQLQDLGIERGEIETVAEALIAAERRRRDRSA